MLASVKQIEYCVGDSLATVSVHHVIAGRLPVRFRITFDLAVSPHSIGSLAFEEMVPQLISKWRGYLNVGWRVQ